MVLILLHMTEQCEPGERGGAIGPADIKACIWRNDLENSNS